MYRILIADENYIDTNTIQYALQQECDEKFCIRAVYNAEDTLYNLHSFLPQILVLDISLPRIGGIKLATQIYENGTEPFKNISLVFTSNYYDYTLVKESVHYNTLDFLIKPFKPERLVNSIAKVIKGSSQLPMNVQIDCVHSSVRQTCDFLKANITKSFSVKELANRVQISPNYLSHLFVKDMGMTLISYHNAIKIEQAKQVLLENPYLKVYEIAFRVGYDDDKYFCRLFKKHCGITPGRYRQKFL